MLTLLAPLYLYAAAAVAAGAVAAHFIVTRPPRSSVLPTVRFVPPSTVRVVTFERPRDRLLLLLRVLIVLLIGLGFARPVLVPERQAVARIVIADVSRAVGDIDEVRDSARSLLGAGDLLVLAGEGARVVGPGATDTAAALEHSTREGGLSAALVAAIGAAPELREVADSIELAIVSAFRAHQIDGATEAIRALWPGRIRLVPVAASADTLAPAGGVSIRAESEEDGVALAARLAGLVDSSAHEDAPIRIVRGPASAEDSAWAAAGGTLVRWPSEGAPPGWRERERPDTAGAVIAGAATAEAATLVFPVERRWEPAMETEPQTETEQPARVVARWVDGEAAATERSLGAGCVRDVAIPVPERGDLVLRPTFGQMVRVLSSPCGGIGAAGSAAGSTAGSTGGALLDEAALAALEGTGGLAAREEIPEGEVVRSPWAPWLLVAALILALVELWARRGAEARRGAVRENVVRENVVREGVS